MDRSVGHQAERVVIASVGMLAGMPVGADLGTVEGHCVGGT